MSGISNGIISSACSDKLKSISKNFSSSFSMEPEKLASTGKFLTFASPFILKPFSSTKKSKVPFEILNFGLITSDENLLAVPLI